jgi:hypothetical protein
MEGIQAVIEASSNKTRIPSHPSPALRRVALVFWLIVALIGLCLLSGCHYNSPFRYQEWADEQRFGATFEDRLEVVRGLAASAQQVSPAEQEKISQDLAARVGRESNELMRMELIRTLGAYPTEAAFQALAQAANDPAPRVRRVACEQLGSGARPEAVQILANALQSDAASDVRMAAARSLGELGDPRATAALARALDDGNPAMQRRAMRSLANVSQQDLGNNVVAWKNYTRDYLGEGQQAIASQTGPAQVVPAGGNY